MYNIIILRSRSQSQCKRFFKDGEDIRSKPADPTKYFRYESKAVDGIAEFASLLTDLEQDRRLRRKPSKRQEDPIERALIERAEALRRGASPG